MSISRSGQSRIGLTLLELMVVLVILAIVATVAIQSLQPQVDNQRFLAASGLLNQIRDATIGPRQKYQVDGTPLLSGFVADIGRLPRAESSSLDSPESNVMAELWSVNTQLAIEFPFQFRTGPNQSVDYSDVRLPCGWRGPYLHLPVGAREIRDPWGRGPELTSTSDGRIQTVQITVPANVDQDEPNILLVDLTTSKVEVTGTVMVDNPDNSSIHVALLAPDPETSLTFLAVLDDEDEQSNSFFFRNVPVGLRAIAVEIGGKMKIKYIMVPHGGLNVVFDLRSHNQMPTENSPVPSSETSTD